MKITFVFLSCFSFVYGENIEAYKRVRDLCYPTIEELKDIQYELNHAPRPDLIKFWDKEFIPREFKLIGSEEDEQPQHYHAAVNSEEDEKENAVIIYSSFNLRYPEGAKRLFSIISHSDFKGHVDCRIGGWPDIEGGSLTLAHVPFAFKACFFKEMQRKGYKRVLWLDASILPVVSLNLIFQIIQKKGYFVQANTHVMHSPYLNEEVANYFGFSFKEASQLLSCSAAIFGVDFTNRKAAELIDQWYLSAKDSCAFYSPRSDQNALSLLLHKMGMTSWAPPSILGEPNHQEKTNLFLMDRSYVK